MRTSIAFFTMAMAVISAAPAAAGKPKAKTADGAADGDKAMAKDEKAKLAEHMKLRNHIEKDVKYPATKEDILAKCNGVKEVKADDRKWFEDKLPSGSYNSAADVEKAIGWEVTEPATEGDKPSGKSAAKPSGKSKS